ncbi:MAG: maleylpyruvate isomerase N-terminal domain-containing protein, partial [Acidimicrobiia bacterium]
MPILEMYETVRAGFSERLYKVSGDQWHLPTPCTKWDVRDLLHHLVYVQRWVPPLAAGETVAE